MRWIPGLLQNDNSKQAQGMAREKKAPADAQGFYSREAWRCPTLTWGDPTLPSALSVFTSEFGMESGGSRSLLPPGKAFDDRHPKDARHRIGNNSNFFSTRVANDMPHAKVLWRYMAKPHEQLVPVSFIHYWTSTPSLSTS